MDPSHLFRATFLDLVLSPVQAAAWRRVGEDIYQGLLGVAGNRPDVPGVTLEPGLQAILSDVEYLARMTAFLGSGSDHEPREQFWRKLSQDTSKRLEGLAFQLRQEIAVRAKSQV